MGNDGGSIPTRRELVKEGAKDLTTTQVKEIQTEQQEHFWSTCALSHEPLSQPVVSDGLGTLYNKDAVLAYLLSISQKEPSKSALANKGEAFKDRLRSLKDVVEVRFHTGDDEAAARKREWICPITSKKLGPGTKSFYLVPCGHAFAESVVKEMASDVCLQCNEPFDKNDIISILPVSQAEKDRLTERLVTLNAQGHTHSLKKASGTKKRKKGEVADSEPEHKAVENGHSQNGHTSHKGAGESKNIQNADTASLTAKVLAEQGDRDMKRKRVGNENVQSLYAPAEKLGSRNADFMTRGFTIPANAKR